jgi:hypothetical protein
LALGLKSILTPDYLAHARMIAGQMITTDEAAAAAADLVESVAD